MHKSMIKAILIPIAGFFIIGVILLFAGIGFALAIRSAGYTSNIEFVLVLMGIISIIISIFFIIKIPFNPSIKCWKHYGDSDIDEIDNIIKSNQKSEIIWGNWIADSQIRGLIVTNSWIIDVTNYIFVKPEDVNWIYIKLIQGKNCYLNEITIFTTFSLKFSVSLNAFCTQNELNSSDYDIQIKYNYLQTICPQAILGIKPEYEQIWKQSPENFIRNVKSR